MSHLFEPQHFIEAQDSVYEDVLAQLTRGKKTSHWMWYLFPQMTGISTSPMSLRYSMYSIDQARAYNAHPVLGSRLRECTELVMEIEGRTIEQIFGHPDFLKFRSCMTLFDRVDAESNLYQNAIEHFFDGVPDPLTIELL